MNFNTKYMSNYPAGADNDPNAPWNRDDSNYTERVEEYTSRLANDISTWLSEEMLKSMADLDVPEDVFDEVYDEIYNRAKQIWEQ